MPTPRATGTATTARKPADESARIAALEELLHCDNPGRHRHHPSRPGLNRRCLEGLVTSRETHADSCSRVALLPL